jgi:outer membrane protein, multidrug efflux system
MTSGSPAHDTAAAKASCAVDQVRLAWRAGESPILDLLDALFTQLAAEDALSQAQIAELCARDALFVALGG